ncbi:MAG: DEAD/DEAH box helicase [Candidatus Aenigmatarchaeota archaeon]
MQGKIKFVSHPWINPNAIEARSYQDAIVRTALSGNTLCVLPTGLGKTSIAALVAAERLHHAFEAQKKKSNRSQADFMPADSIPSVCDSKVLFLAPTRPLVAQHKRSFERFMKIGPDEIAAVTGAMKPIDRKRAYQHADIVISTPQTTQNDLKNGILNLSPFNLLIVDEAHRSVGNYAYVFIAKRYIEEAKDPLILALTASPGASRAKIEQIKNALSIKNVSIRSREDEDVKPYVQKVQNIWVEVDLPQALHAACEGFARLRQSCIDRLHSLGLEELGIRLPAKLAKKQILMLHASLSKRKHWKSFAAMSILAELLKLDHALLLLETQSLYSFERYIARLRDDESKATMRLLANAMFNAAVNAIVELSANGMENPKLSRLKGIVKAELDRHHHIIIFTQYRDTVDRIMQVLKEIPGANPAAFIGQASKARRRDRACGEPAECGGVTSRGMSQKEQLQIIKDFRSGFYNILVATSIGEEGLDIEETDAVIFYEPIPSEIRSIQRSGRTGRTRPGKVIVLIAKNTRDQAFYWSAYHKQKKMTRLLQGMQAKNASLDPFIEGENDVR